MSADTSNFEEEPNEKTSQRTRFWRLLRRKLTAGFGMIAVALVVGYCYEASERSRIALELTPPGNLIDVGGRNLHFRVQGAGSPTVILEGGTGEGTIEWTLVAPEIAKVTRVVSYDRAGLGWSDASTSPKTAEAAVEDLRAALEAQGIIDGPLVLVGHSLGGHYVRMFQYQHPEHVVGLVLVDAAHEEQRSRLPQEFHNEMKELDNSMAVAAKLSPFGFPRLTMTTDGVAEVFPELLLLPETARSAWLQLMPGSAMQTFVEESKAFDGTCEQVKEAAVPLDELPLTVISSGKAPFELGESYTKAWLEMQAELAALSKNGTQRIVEDSGHYVQIERPDVVVEEVVGMVESLRNSLAESP